MRFFEVISPVLIATLAAAQRIQFGFPAEGTSIPAGSNLTIEIDRPDTLSASKEVALVLGLQTCAEAPCPPPDSALGTTLYSGGFDPQFQIESTGKPPHQNFTVFVPPTTPKGTAQLSAMHLSLIGAGPMPFMELKNITINIV
ncbi:hypothetical protein HGRIS_010853 [Hohenbuehelia grisea]|uniref:Phosphatidylglycerol/phosphatidylinositol transfer protein n=1 Tax=Hohenbuehelia grisea TaxID=104357 RepID=A0ABR3IYD1_9AGAR